MASPLSSMRLRSSTSKANPFVFIHGTLLRRESIRNALKPHWLSSNLLRNRRKQYSRNRKLRQNLVALRPYTKLFLLFRLPTTTEYFSSSSMNTCPYLLGTGQSASIRKTASPEHLLTPYMNAAPFPRSGFNSYTLTRLSLSDNWRATDRVLSEPDTTRMTSSENFSACPTAFPTRTSSLKAGTTTLTDIPSRGLLLFAISIIPFLISPVPSQHSVLQSVKFQTQMFQICEKRNVTFVFSSHCHWFLPANTL
jgi:hypothetical protein